MSGTFGNLKMPSMRRKMWKTPAPSKPRIESVIPPEDKRETTGILSRENLHTTSTDLEYATLKSYRYIFSFF